MAFLHALRYGTAKALSEGTPIAAQSIDDAVEALIFGPRGDQFVASVVEAPILGQNSDSEAAEHAGEGRKRWES